MKMHVALIKPNRKGFTLVELVVVILVMGIVAAVAAPKMFNTTNDARDNSTRQSLIVLRNAIELFKAHNSEYPGSDGNEATLKADLAEYLQGPFPIANIKNVPGDGSVKMESSGTALTGDATADWCYDNLSGEIIINHADYDHH